VSARVGWGLLLRRQLRSERGSLLVIALTTVLVTVALTVWPRAVDRMVGDDLTDRVAAQGDVARDLTYPREFTWVPDALQEDGPSAWDFYADTLEESRTQIAGPALRGVIGAGEQVAIRSELPVPTGDRRPDITAMGLTVLVDADVADRVRVVEGRAPAPVDREDLLAPDGAIAMPATIEIMLSAGTAEEMGWQIGESRSAREASLEADFVLVGTFEGVDAQDGYWGHLPSTLQPWVETDDNRGWTVHGVAYADLGTLPALAAPMGVQFRFWFPVDSAAVGRADRAALITDLERMRTLDGARSGTTDILRDTATRESTIGTVGGVLAVGAAGTAVGVLWLAAGMAVARRRSALVLLRARGASEVRVRGLLAVQGLASALPAGVLGTVLGVLLVPGRVDLGDLLLPAAATLLPALLLALAPGGTARAGRREARGVLGPWRWVVEVLVLAAAALSVVTLARRGTTGSAGDPLVVALPVLLGLAVGVLVLRAYPWPLRAAVLAARRRRGLGVFLGVAQAARAPAAGVVPVVALVMGVASVILSGATISTLHDAAVQGAVRAVGADLSLDRVAASTTAGVGITDEEIDAARQVDGVAAVAAVGDGGRRAYASGRTSDGAEVVVVDAAALREVQDGLDGVAALPDALAGDDGAPAVVVSDGLDLDRDLPLVAKVGADLTEVPLDPVGALDRVPGVATGQSWILVDRDAWQRASGLTPDVDRLLVRLAPGADAASVADALEDAVSGVRATTLVAEQAEVTEATLVAGMRTLVVAVAGLSVLLCAAVLGLLLLAGAPARGRMTALLVTLGAPRGVRRLLVLGEAAAPLLAAGVGGLLAGSALPALVLGATDLRLFTGAAADPAVTLDPALAAGMLVVGLLVVLAGVALAVRAARRVDPTGVLREGEGA
jgi:putative ABC transport system permease protein